MNYAQWKTSEPGKRGGKPCIRGLRIVPFLQGAYPGSTQVALIGKERASDCEIWEYARDNGFTIVTKDSDFYDLSLMLGAPRRKSSGSRRAHHQGGRHTGTAGQSGGD